MGKKSRVMSAGTLLTPVSSLGPAPAFPAAAQQQIPNAPSFSPFPPQQMPIGGSLDGLSTTIMWLNTNPYLIGMFMLLLNLGGRFLSLELTKKQEAFLQAPWIRPVIFFTVIFIATRNLVVAFWITILFFFIIWVVANENSPFCLIPNWCGHDTKTPAELYQANIEKMQGNYNI